MDVFAYQSLIERFESFTPAAVMVAGLLDGINPCAFSTIVFFLSFLALAGFNLRQMALVCLSFVSAVFLTYLGLGLGVFAGLERLQVFSAFSKYFDTAVGWLAIILGLVSLYDYACFKRGSDNKEMILRLPVFIKNTIHKSMRAIKDSGRTGMTRLLFVSFIIGVAVSLLESVCTGQVYLPTITFILKMKVMWWRAFLLLALYNAMFILPLIAVSVSVLCGVNSEWWAAVVRGNLGRVKLATALFFFCLGIFMLLV